MEYLIKQYALEPGAWEIQYIEEYFGEFPRRKTADEIITFCRTSLTEYKVPRSVEVRDTLPMSAVGKILYRVLRDEHATADASS